MMPLACCLALAAAAQSLPEQLIEAGHWKQARALVEAEARKNPNNALASYLLSQIRNAFHDRSSPLTLAEKAVELDGRTAKYHRQLAEVLGVTAQHSGVFQQLMLARRFRKEIDLALALDPGEVLAMRDLMEYYLLAPAIVGGDKTKARLVAGQIARADPVEGRFAEARLARMSQETEKLEPLLRGAVEAQPNNYRARIALAEHYLASTGTHELAAQQARAALRIDRGRVDGYSVLAEVYAVRGNAEDLDAVLAAAEKAVPDDLTPHYRAGNVLLTLNRDASRAERLFRKYLTAEPEGNAPTLADAHWKLGLVLERIGHSDEAHTEWSAAVRLDPESPAARDLRR